MKHCITIILGLLLSGVAFAQTSEDLFDSYESMVGNRAIFYNAYSSYLNNGPYAYENRDGKFKVLKDGSVYQSIDSVPVSIIGIAQDKKKQYLSIRAEGATLFLLIDKKHNYLNNTRSVSYWEEEFGKLTDNYSNISYLSQLITFNGDKKGLVFGEYLPVSWFSIQCPTQFQDVFKIECSVQNKSYYWTLDDIKRNISSFLSNEEYDTKQAIEQARILAELREKERLDSIADVTTICEAKILHTTEAGAILEKKNINKYDEEDTLYLSIYGIEDKETGPSYNKKNVRYYKGYTLGEEFSFPASALSFTDESAKAFIESRGNAGIERRKAVALKNDDKRGDEYVQRIVERAEWQLERLNALEKFRQQKKILIISQEYSYSSYQFGLKFGFYNCYQKDIKYVNLTITAYNRVGDVQRDDVGRSKTEVRCIGPLEKGEIASYDFNDLFWDENDIINKLVVTNVKITFMDNTVVSYSGQKAVELHMARHYAEEQMKILQEGKK